MKIIIAFLGAIVILTVASAQSSTCTDGDLAKLKDITSRVDTCKNAHCMDNETNCQCCVRIRDSSSSSSNATACCREYATGVALFQQCKSSLNLTSEAQDEPSRKRLVNVNFSIHFDNCSFGLFGSGAGEMVHAVSAVTLLSSIVVATMATIL